LNLGVRAVGLGLLTGVFAAGLLGGYLWGGGTATPVHAQQPGQAAAPGRYWATSWGTHLGHGVYVVDTQTGEVFSVTNEDRPKSLGKPGDNR
jgi:hypothetical protein